MRVEVLAGLSVARPVCDHKMRIIEDGDRVATCTSRDEFGVHVVVW